MTAAEEGNAIKVRVSFIDDLSNAETLTSAVTNTVTAAGPSEPPAKPQGLTGTFTHEAVSLTWDDPGDSTITGYQILRRDRAIHGPGEFQIHVDDTGTADSAYVDRDVLPEGSYTYRIRARNAAGPGKRSGKFRADLPSAPPQNSPASGAPTIRGTAEVGKTLTADNSGITDADGLTSVVYSYSWISNDGSSDSDIQNATGSSYTLVAADEGKTIMVKVRFTDDAGNHESLTSAASASVAARPNSAATGAPAINGKAQVGETLTADTSGISDSDGLTNVFYSYQWVRNDGSSDKDIPNENGSTYTLADLDEGQTIKVRVSFTDDAEHDESLTSAATSEVVAPSVPLTAILESQPVSHNGTDVFTFQFRFSEEFRLSYKKLRDRAFTVDGGTVTKASRQVKSSNIAWTITVLPDSNGAVTIVLPVTDACSDRGAICTSDGRKLSNRLELTISGPSGW